MKTILITIGVLFFAANVHAQNDKGKIILPDHLEWVQIVEGVDLAAVDGDWSKDAHRKFIRIAAGMVLPFHIHTASSHIVIVAGELTHTHSANDKPNPMGVGSYFYSKGGVVHANSCVSKVPCILYTEYDSAFDMEIVSN